MPRFTVDVNIGAQPVNDASGAVDSVELTVPLLLRLLEWAREDAPDDLSLHRAVERLANVDAVQRPVTIEQYKSIVGSGS